MKRWGSVFLSASALAFGGVLATPAAAAPADMVTVVGDVAAPVAEMSLLQTR